MARAVVVHCAGALKDLAEEIEVHLAMATRERIERGMALRTRRAPRPFANSATSRSSSKTTRRGMSRGRGLEQLLQDVRLGGRILRQAPGAERHDHLPDRPRHRRQHHD